MDDAGEMDVDQCLIGKFSSMGTTDRDVLISEFRKLLGFQLNVAGCEFFLDMTNWNLNAAIGAYYDFEQPQGKLPSMTFVRDITIGEGEAVPPDTDFLKTWRLQNNGDEKWPLGCTLRFVNGEKMSAPDWVAVAELSPANTIDVSVRMKSPSQPGLYQGQWRIYNRNMLPFGDNIWVIISVEAGGLLGVTQQMSQFASALGSPRSGFGGLAGPSNSPQQQQGQEGGGNPFAMQSGSPGQFGGNPEGPYFGERLDEDSEMSDMARCVLTPIKSPVGSFQAIKHASSSPSCWNARSPTALGGDPGDDVMAEGCHALQCIEEAREPLSSFPETNNGAGDRVVGGGGFLASSSSYDLNARQASPFSSPSKLLELERSFSSPDAPSPIRPTSKSILGLSGYHRSTTQNKDDWNNYDVNNPLGTPSAAQRLDFSSGS